MASRNEMRRRWRLEQKSKGLCVHCNEPVLACTSMCARHTAAAANRRRSKSTASRCNNCSAPRLPDRAYCQRCKDKISAKHKEMYAKKRADGVCFHCDQPAVPGKTGCAPCLKKHRLRLAAIKDSRREAGLCPGCGQEYPCPNADLCTDCFFKVAAGEHLGTRADWRELKSLFEAQGGRCAYSGLRLRIGVDASLDHRISISRGGRSVLENVQWVLEAVNQMKRHYSEDEFFELIAAIYRHSLT